MTEDAEAPVTLRVMIVDDHHTLAELLAFSLSAQPDLEFVGHAGSTQECLAMLPALQPDVVLMDYSLPDGNGLELTRKVRQLRPDVRVVMLTAATDPQLIARAGMLGVSAFLSKSGRLGEILTALRTARDGTMTVPPELVAGLVPGARSGTPRPRLTARELEVLELLAEGFDARRAARQLGISLNTCRGYVKAVLHKLGVHSQLEAVAVARRWGLIGSHG